MKIITIFSVALITFPVIVESISNGNFVSIKEVPYLVSLTFSGSFCGGAIISEFYVITAAHCVDDYEFIGYPDKINTGRSVSFGQHDSQFVIEKIYIFGDHADERWDSINEDYTEYDIALVKLKSPIQFNEYQKPIEISSSPPKSGDKMTICGFGTMGVIKGDSPSLRTSDVTVIDSNECKPYAKPVHVPNSLFCAGNGTTDVCPGDSGGPVIINGKLAGIVSSGPDCHFYPIHDRSPGLYTRVDLCYDWIMKVTGIKY